MVHISDLDSLQWTTVLVVIAIHRFRKYIDFDKEMIVSPWISDSTLNLRPAFFEKRFV